MPVIPGFTTIERVRHRGLRKSRRVIWDVNQNRRPFLWGVKEQIVDEDPGELEWDRASVEYLSRKPLLTTVVCDRSSPRLK